VLCCKTDIFTQKLLCVQTEVGTYSAWVQIGSPGKTKICLYLYDDLGMHISVCENLGRAVWENTYLLTYLGDNKENSEISENSEIDLTMWFLREHSRILLLIEDSFSYI
jgi:hypothetical protein